MTKKVYIAIYRRYFVTGFKLFGTKDEALLFLEHSEDEGYLFAVSIYNLETKKTVWLNSTDHGIISKADLKKFTNEAINKLLNV